MLKHSEKLSITVLLKIDYQKYETFDKQIIRFIIYLIKENRPKYLF